MVTLRIPTAPVFRVLGGLNQPFDLCFGQVLPCPQVLVGRPFRGNCSINGGWRDQPQAGFRYQFRAPGICVWIAGQTGVATFAAMRRSGGVSESSSFRSQFVLNNKIKGWLIG
jgi:hypothetical protein